MRDRILRKVQRDVFNAFLDIYVTENGVAKHPAVVDYYRQDEPIELGPDENMHDDMIEEIARDLETPRLHPRHRRDLVQRRSASITRNTA